MIQHVYDVFFGSVLLLLLIFIILLYYYIIPPHLYFNSFLPSAVLLLMTIVYHSTRLFKMERHVTLLTMERGMEVVQKCLNRAHCDY